MLIGVEFDAEIFCEGGGVLRGESVRCHGPKLLEYFLPTDPFGSPFDPVGVNFREFFR